MAIRVIFTLGGKGKWAIFIYLEILKDYCQRATKYKNKNCSKTSALNYLILRIIFFKIIINEIDYKPLKKR